MCIRDRTSWVAEMAVSTGAEIAVADTTRFAPSPAGTTVDGDLRTILGRGQGAIGQRDDLGADTQNLAGVVDLRSDNVRGLAGRLLSDDGLNDAGDPLRDGDTGGSRGRHPGGEQAGEHGTGDEQSTIADPHQNHPSLSADSASAVRTLGRGQCSERWCEGLSLIHISEPR